MTKRPAWLVRYPPASSAGLVEEEHERTLHGLPGAGVEELALYRLSLGGVAARPRGWRPGGHRPWAEAARASPARSLHLAGGHLPEDGVENSAILVVLDLHL